MHHNLEPVNLFLADLDGTLTDGTYLVTDGTYLFLTNNVKMAKQFNTHDFKGFSILDKVGIKVGVLTGANSGIESWQMARAAPFADCFCGVDDKLALVEKHYIKKRNFRWENIAFIGDDTNDIPLLRKVGYAACPADANERVINVVENRQDAYVCASAGGQRCVREFIDFLLQGYEFTDQDLI